jgi:hypothetical protein
MTAATGHAGLPQHPAQQQHAVAQPLLWFGLFGGAAAWALQLLTNYALFAHFCYPSFVPLASPTFGGVRALGIASSAVFLAVAVAALLVAFRSWSRTRAEAHQRRDAKHHHDAAEVGEGRTRFMAMSGMLVSGIMVYAVLMNAVPAVFMPVCVF